MAGDVVPFVCKHCGSETFKTSSEPKTYEDFLGATCAQCGAVVTDEDIKAQAVKIAEALLNDAFKDFR